MAQRGEETGRQGRPVTTLLALIGWWKGKENTAVRTAGGETPACRPDPAPSFAAAVRWTRHPQQVPQWVVGRFWRFWHSCRPPPRPHMPLRTQS